MNTLSVVPAGGAHAFAGRRFSEVLVGFYCPYSVKSELEIGVFKLGDFLFVV